MFKEITEKVVIPKLNNLRNYMKNLADAYIEKDNKDFLEELKAEDRVIDEGYQEYKANKAIDEQQEGEASRGEYEE